MKAKKRLPQQVQPELAFLIPDYLLFCENLLWSRERGGNVSLINVVDAFHAESLPYDVGNFWLIAAFYRNPAISFEETQNARITHRVTLTAPSKTVLELGTFDVALQNNALVYRLLVDFSNQLQLKSKGAYVIEVFEKSRDSAERSVLKRLLPVYEKKDKSQRITETDKAEGASN